MRMPYITRTTFYLMIILVFCTSHIPLTISSAESSRSQKADLPKSNSLNFLETSSNFSYYAHQNHIRRSNRGSLIEKMNREISEDSKARNCV